MGLEEIYLFEKKRKRARKESKDDGGGLLIASIQKRPAQNRDRFASLKHSKGRNSSVRQGVR